MAQFVLGRDYIKNPSSFRIEHYIITDSTRLANGDMAMDPIAIKRKFELKYKAISGAELKVIIDALWANVITAGSCFVQFEFPNDGVNDSAMVYAGSIPKELHRGDNLNWIWKDVNFSLIER